MKKLKISLIDAIGNLAASRMPSEKKRRILREASNQPSLEEEIKYILEHLPEEEGESC